MFNFSGLWDLGKNGEGCSLKNIAIVVKREMIGAIYSMTWSDRTPRDTVGVLATLTSAVTVGHDFDKLGSHTAATKSFGKEVRSDSDSALFCFSSHFLKSVWGQHSILSITPYYNLLTSGLCFICNYTHHNAIKI